MTLHFFFSSRRRHTRCYRDWSSDVCSSDLSFGATSFFADSETLDAWLGIHRSLVRMPERRFTLDGQAEVRAGRNYAPGLGRSEERRVGKGGGWRGGRGVLWNERVGVGVNEW